MDSLFNSLSEGTSWLGAILTAPMTICGAMQVVMSVTKWVMQKSTVLGSSGASVAQAAALATSFQLSNTQTEDDSWTSYKRRQRSMHNAQVVVAVLSIPPFILAPESLVRGQYLISIVCLVTGFTVSHFERKAQQRSWRSPENTGVLLRGVKFLFLLVFHTIAAALISGLVLIIAIVLVGASNLIRVNSFGVFSTLDYRLIAAGMALWVGATIMVAFKAEM